MVTHNHNKLREIKQTPLFSSKTALAKTHANTHTRANINTHLPSPATATASTHPLRPRLLASVRVVPQLPLETQQPTPQ